MLAQNFKTAADLQITTVMHSALMKVLGMLEREELVFCPQPKRTNIDPTVPNGFNMGITWAKEDCGTVGCLAGWAANVMGVPWESLLHIPSLEPVFYPHFCELAGGTDAADKITPAEAAMALRNFLSTGKPEWNEVCASH